MSFQASLDYAAICDATFSSLPDTAEAKARPGSIDLPFKLRQPLSTRSVNLTSTALGGDPPAAKYIQPAFRPLPPVRRTSSLQLSSLDFTFHFSLSPTVGSLHTPDESRPTHLLSHTVKEEEDDEDEDDAEDGPTQVLHLPPSLAHWAHPNSPYVPWPSPIRRDFVRPSTPNSLCPPLAHSRPVSRSGACAPEPTELPRLHRAVQALRKVSYGVNRLSRLFKRHLARRKRDPYPRAPSAAYNPEQASSVCIPPTLPEPPTLSTFSLESTKSNSLSLWLAKRKKDAAQNARSRLMTLEEYDRTGSWAHVRARKDSVMSSGVYSPYASVTTFAEHR
ncbi:hypothetical protein CYLTODRAFT_424287 [Cylindrobasidium torrendii FP15055 ss-10]|uniref:Uncharacterized protein n=1 Tax=Cylindrobasidium torrendii FP15055 ss-10 TaxID=1314674 RepID=A0A0D7B5N3_9AGAR|nr:hypothetical protein CYLTODRAFT_424287 [Cylindrobasidium torrendii FP15055 ss-10]